MKKQTEKLRLSVKSVLSIVKQHLQQEHPHVEIVSIGVITSMEMGTLKQHGKKTRKSLPVFRGVTIKVVA